MLTSANARENERNDKNCSPQSTAVNWIRQHELIGFVALTFLFSWSIYLLAALWDPQNGAVLSRLTLIAAFGPSLSAILVSATRTSRDEAIPPSRRAALFAFVLIVATAVEWVDHLWWAHRIQIALVVLDALLVTLVAFVVSRLYSARQGVRGLMQPIARWRAGPGWYVLALCLWPALVLAGNAIARWLAIELPPPPTWPDIPMIPIVLESLCWFLLFGGPLSEEPGWRGFALPRLQDRFSPLVASVILGALWGLWHVPLHMMGMYYGGALGAVIRIELISRAILFTWLYNQTKGSLLLSILFHAAINTTSLFLPRSYPVAFGLCTGIAAVVVATDRMWRRLPAGCKTCAGGREEIL